MIEKLKAKREVLKRVERILESNPETRANDFLLIAEVLADYGVPKNYTLSDIAGVSVYLTIPSFECITRCRRMVQEQRQELISWKMAVKREEEKEVFEAFSKEALHE